MAPPSDLYTYTYTAFSPSNTYSCSSYRAELSQRYGICKSLHREVDPETLDLASITIFGTTLGNTVSALFFLIGLLAMLYVLKWVMNGRVRRRKWSWDLDADGEVRACDEDRRFKSIVDKFHIVRVGRRFYLAGL